MFCSPACSVDDCLFCEMVEEEEQCIECIEPFKLEDGECTGCDYGKYEEEPGKCKCK